MYWQIHTIENDEQRLSLHAYMAGGKALWLYVFAKSQFFPTTKEYILFNYKVGLITIEKVHPTQSQLSIIIKPNQIIIRVMRST